MAAPLAVILAAIAPWARSIPSVNAVRTDAGV
jgi:hypothetical protein